MVGFNEGDRDGGVDGVSVVGGFPVPDTSCVVAGACDGSTEGENEGKTEGAWLGFLLGWVVGFIEGDRDGGVVGISVVGGFPDLGASCVVAGACEGSTEGASEGENEGKTEGAWLGFLLGCVVGFNEGDRDGGVDGMSVDLGLVSVVGVGGPCEGATEGESEGAQLGATVVVVGAGLGPLAAVGEFEGTIVEGFCEG